MKILGKISEQQVWDHWMAVERHTKSDFRKDIRNPLPQDIRWCKAEIEELDLDKLFIISSSDWTDISNGTFKVLDVAAKIKSEIVSDNKDTVRLETDILKKINFINCGGSLDPVLFLVAPTVDGNFTLIEGNRRAVVFSLLNRIIECPVFLGLSTDILKYNWARKSR